NRCALDLLENDVLVVDVGFARLEPNNACARCGSDAGLQVRSGNRQRQTRRLWTIEDCRNLAGASQRPDLALGLRLAFLAIQIDGFHFFTWLNRISKLSEQ